MNSAVPTTDNALKSRLAKIDPEALEKALDADGYALVKGLLSARSCRQLIGLYASDAPFRRHIHMERHGYGRGEYKYFTYPLPPVVGDMRHTLYPLLAPTANRWYERMALEPRFPAALRAYLEQCHEAGQMRPTPLILKYGVGDYNRLHQDIYGDLLFPLQVTVLLSQPEDSFTGGEFILTEQRPRMQSRADIVPLNRGDAVIFPVRNRPVHGTKRDFRVTMRHGVSRLRSGQRYTLGLIFHDAA